MRHRFNPWLRNIPLQEGMATHSSIIAWEIPWTEEPGGLQSLELQRVRHNWVLMQHAVIFFLFIYLFLEANYFTILYWFCHTLTWIRHGCTCVPHSEPSSQLPPHPIPLGHPSAPAGSPCIMHRSVSHMIIYMFQCHSPKPSHPRPLPQSPKDCSEHLCKILNAAP